MTKRRMYYSYLEFLLLENFFSLILLACFFLTLFGDACKFQLQVQLNTVHLQLVSITNTERYCIRLVVWTSGSQRLQSNSDKYNSGNKNLIYCVPHIMALLYAVCSQFQLNVTFTVSKNKVLREQIAVISIGTA